MGETEPKGLEAIGQVPICGSCGSERVVRDAWACWNREAGMWELEQTFDHTHCPVCEGQVQLVWVTPDQPPNARIRDLNDVFRMRGVGRGTVQVTAGVAALGDVAVLEILGLVKSFDVFSDDNDPWGEHDFGAFDFGDDKVFWKIDAYDLELSAHSPNAANPAITHRVLTVMLAAEY